MPDLNEWERSWGAAILNALRGLDLDRVENVHLTGRWPQNRRAFAKRLSSEAVDKLETLGKGQGWSASTPSVVVLLRSAMMDIAKLYLVIKEQGEPNSYRIFERLIVKDLKRAVDSLNAPTHGLSDASERGHSKRFLNDVLNEVKSQLPENLANKDLPDRRVIECALEHLRTIGAIRSADAPFFTIRDGRLVFNYEVRCDDAVYLGARKFLSAADHSDFVSMITASGSVGAEELLGSIERGRAKHQIDRAIELIHLLVKNLVD